MAKKQLYFPRRIPEPKAMNHLEHEVFNKASQDNYKRWMIPLVDEALEVSRLSSGKILDVGCGPGLLAKEFAGRSGRFQIVGIDTSVAAIKLARVNCHGISNIALKKASVYKLPFSDGVFDLVVCKDSLHHFDKLSAALREMYRVTKHGGVVYLQDLRRDLPWYLLKTVIPPRGVFQKLQYYSARAAYVKNELAVLLNRLSAGSYYIRTRKVSRKLRNRYRGVGVDLDKLKEGFRSRYIAVARKR